MPPSLAPLISLASILIRAVSQDVSSTLEMISLNYWVFILYPSSRVGLSDSFRRYVFLDRERNCNIEAFEIRLDVSGVGEK